MDGGVGPGCPSGDRRRAHRGGHRGGYRGGSGVSLTPRVRAIERSLGPDLEPRPLPGGGWAVTPDWNEMTLRDMDGDPEARAIMHEWYLAHPEEAEWLRTHPAPATVKL